MVVREEEEISDNPFSLNISEEVVSLEAVLHQEEATNESQMIKNISFRSSSQSSGEGPLKKRKTSVVLPGDSVAVIETEEAVIPPMTEENIFSTVQSKEGDKKDSAPSLLNQENVSENEPVDLNNEPMEDLSSTGCLDADNDSEDLPVHDLNVMIIPEIDNLNNVVSSHQLLKEIPIGDSVDIAADQSIAEVSANELLVLKTEVTGLKGELAVMRSGIEVLKVELGEAQKELIEVKKELENMKKELNEVKAEIPKAECSEHIINGAICLFQKLVRTGLISSDVAMNPLLWNSP